MKIHNHMTLKASPLSSRGGAKYPRKARRQRTCTLKGCPIGILDKTEETANRDGREGKQRRKRRQLHTDA